MSSLVMDGYCFRVQCTLPNVEKMLFWMKNSNKIQKKIRKKQGWIDDDAGRALFLGSNVHFQIWKHLHF